MCKSFVKMHKDFVSGDIDAATDLQQRANRVIEALLGTNGKLLAAMKYLMRERLGLPAGYVHPNTSADLTDAEKEQLNAALVGFEDVLQ
eukprot:SAG31_NODE_6863_length_1867_cov_1.623869_1_plen_89_part_00